MARRNALRFALALALVPPAAADQAWGQAVGAQAIGQRDRQTGADAHPKLLEEYGGAVSGPQASYVETVGKTIAVQSGLSNARGDFTVTLLNSPVNNAFAIPGGYVYVTRQLVALMNSEAELAAVLGHEVGHVSARHAAKRQSAATRNQVIGVLGSVLSGALLGNNALGQLGQRAAAQGSQLLTLGYSRGQETEADNLGIAILQRAGYDAGAMASVLESLARQNALDSRLNGTEGRATPAWASTHPDPASRVRAAAVRAGTTRATSQRDRDAFLSRIDGLLYGDDPRQGVVEGRRFSHPDLKLGFDAPEGFVMANGTRSVTIQGRSGKAEFSGAAYDGSLERYIGDAFTALAGGRQRLEPQSIERTTVNGLPAAYGVMRLQGQGGGQLDVAVFAYEFSRSQAFHFTTISPAGGAGVFNPMFRSLRRLSASEAAAVRPRYLRAVTVQDGDTPQSLAARMAFPDARLDRFLVLNGLDASSRLIPGQRVKIVTY